MYVTTNAHYIGLEELEKLLKLMSQYKVTKFNYNGVSVEFELEKPTVEQAGIKTFDLATAMPPDDEMQFYATEEFDRLRAEREAAKLPPF